ncbi:hypothetical protein GCM10010371_35060 [Streptomyces subrutilus]|uniref:Uncharacterized protein n=1 Tax=Streptomyces subrutilus TaxID=36818 RepID=A0A918QY05_9ACTN|nr:hypothetical protein GCM10010371_35060 [Streptomyces subrutilus]
MRSAGGRASPVTPTEVPIPRGPRRIPHRAPEPPDPRTIGIGPIGGPYPAGHDRPRARTVPRTGPRHPDA